MNTKDKKILIVEDEVVIAMDLQSSLQSQGYNVIGHITRGEDVISFIASNKPDIILMDVKLDGEIDGVETAQIIYDNHDIPVIFITSYSNKTIIERAKKTNPFGYIVKPFDDRELYTNIELAFFKHDSEKKIKESEKKYRELSESIQQIIIEIDSRGHICYLNEPGMQILGLTLSEIDCNLSIKEFIGEQGFEKIKNRFDNPYGIKQIALNREHMLINKFGKRLFVDEFLSPVYNKDTIIGYRGILIDITSQKLKETLNILYNKITLIYDELKADPFEIIKFLISEFKKHFFYIEEIYFNENNPAIKQIIKHTDDAKVKRDYGNGYSEYAIEAKKPLYLRGKGLENFNSNHKIQITGTKAICWTGFPINFQNQNFGVFVFQSFKNENALSISDFDNLNDFFTNINSLFERISYLKEIQKSEEKYKRLVNSINEGVIQIDLNTKITFVNKQLCEITEYTEKELLGMNLYQAFSLNSKNTKLIKRETLGRKKGLISQYEMLINTKTGKIKSLLINSSLFSNAQGQLIGFVATIIDITEKREILKLINENEQKFKAIFDQAAVGVAIVDSSSGKILHANEKYSKIMGYSYNELLNLNLKETTHPEDLKNYLSNMDKILSGEKREFSIEKRHIRKDSSIVWTNLTVSPLWNENELQSNHIAIIEDISSRKEIEEGLKRSELEKENILKAMPDSFLVVSKERKILNSYCNLNESILKRVNHNNINGYQLKDILKANIIEKITANIDRCFECNELLITDLDFKNAETDNWFEIRYVPINAESVLVVIRNVTSIRNNIIELQKFQNITEQTKELIMITDKEGNIEYANPAFLNITGYELSEIQGQKPSMLKSNKHAPEFYAEMWNTILKGESYKCRMINQKKSKQEYIEEKIISPLFDPKGNITHFISTGKDVTEEIKRERKIRIYQKFEKTLEKKEQKYRTLSLIQGQENERKRIARELHDGLGQMLTVASANLENINLQSIKSKEDKSKIEIVNQMVSEIIQESRRISYNLSPVGLYEFGLEAVLKQLVKRINTNYDHLKIKYTSNLKKERFDGDFEINIYRIIQESIQNSIKHSEASEINISIDYKSKQLEVTINDNGIGFDVRQIGHTDKHFNGIKNIEERAKIIDAKVFFTSSKNEGFKTNLIVKLKNKKNG